MPLPWLIGVAAVAAVAAIAKAVSDDSPSSSSSTTRHDDSERRQQELEAKRKRERENLKARVQSLAGDRREQLKAQLRGAASTLAASSDKHNPISEGVSKMTRLTLEGVPGDQLEQRIRSTASSTSSYGKTVKAILQASPAMEGGQIVHFMQGVNLLESVTAPAEASASDQAALAQAQAAQARIERLQQLKRQLLSQA
ncbi:hypothetical protein YA0871_07475 [Pseudomonas paralactis]|uniref:Uncharacterized protein n=1 Tax=Pseudomonas paralactis TaxID=1615673 RepID=A0ABS0V0D8_9PSED|nr:hypothetical protein [Pseudomonas paralactis]MBC3255297.1 hypothetical protein [Pseudomonas paralactis]MBI6632495.1 hypothetical protein [Pseudomonas paralactis]